MGDMDQHEWLAERFEAERPHPRAVAYRMLGSLSEAGDAVQESWLRLNRADTRAVANQGGWLTTVVARVCHDMLRSRESRCEEPLDGDINHRIYAAPHVVNIPEQPSQVFDFLPAPPPRQTS